MQTENQTEAPTNKQAESAEELRAILVYGIVPELMPHMAFRREKHYKTAGMKIIRCPYCGEVFKAVEVTAKLELICYPRGKNIQWHEKMPCAHCRKEVGIIYMAS